MQQSECAKHVLIWNCAFSDVVNLNVTETLYICSRFLRIPRETVKFFCAIQKPTNSDDLFAPGDVSQLRSDLRKGREIEGLFANGEFVSEIFSFEWINKHLKKKRNQIY